MPKESIDITQYAGVIGSADPKDIPPGAAAYAENLDPINQIGLFRPLDGDTQQNGADLKADLVLPFDDGSIACLVDYDSTDTIRIVNLAGVVGSRMADLDTQAVTRTGPDALASDGESVHVGLGGDATSPPYWAGTIFHQQFGAGTVPRYAIESALIKRADCVGVWVENANVEGNITEYDEVNSLIAFDNQQVSLENGNGYAYFASLVYDGHQEGPLTLIATVNPSKESVQVFGSGRTLLETSTATITKANSNLKNFDGTAITLGGDWTAFTWEDSVTLNEALNGLAKVSFDIRIRTVAGVGGEDTIDPRVTGINIYRAPLVSRQIYPWEAFSGDLALPDPEHIRFIDINDTDWSSAAGTGGIYFNRNTDTYQIYTFTDDLPGSLQTYGSRTGMPATLEHIAIHWGVSCAADSYHIIGQCYHQDLQEIETWLFRSKPGRFGVFDWSNEYLILPSKPNALAYWDGRVYAFGDGRTHVVDPSSFSVEATWEGMGCPAQKSVIVTDRGMFWADDNNIYWHDGNRATPIGAPILYNRVESDTGWLQRTTSVDPVLAYDAVHDAILVIFTDGGGTVGAWMFHVETARWTYVTFSATGPCYSSFQANDGKIWASFDQSSAPRFFSLFNSGTARSWRWVSAIITSIGGKCRYYKARVAWLLGRPDLSFYDDDPDYTTEHALPASGGSWTVVKPKVNDVPIQTVNGTTLDYAREIAFEMAGTNAQDCTQLTIIRRVVSER